MDKYEVAVVGIIGRDLAEAFKKWLEKTNLPKSLSVEVRGPLDQKGESDE